MSRVYERPLKVGKTDYYTLTVNEQWLDGELLGDVSVTADSGAEVVSVQFDDNVIQAVLLGTSSGRHEVHFSWSAAASGRGDCTSAYVDVINC